MVRILQQYPSTHPNTTKIVNSKGKNHCVSAREREIVAGRPQSRYNYGLLYYPTLSSCFKKTNDN